MDFWVVRPSRAAHHDVFLLAALDEVGIVSIGKIDSQEIQGSGGHHEGTGVDDHGDTPGGVGQFHRSGHCRAKR